MINLTVLIIAAIMALGSNLNAAGFRLGEQDAKANAMGNSFVAVADNASAVWYNPAAMTGLEGTNLSLGSVMVYPTMKHEFAGGSDSIAKVMHVPPYFYATHKLNDKWALGLGFNAPFGLSTNWNTVSHAADVATLSDIKTYNYNLNGAYKLNDKISFGLGVDYASLDATLDRMVGSNEMKLTGDGTGWGYNAAAFYKHNDKLTFGANFRSPVKINVDGRAKVAALGASGNNSATTKITLPDTFQIGAAYKANEKWLVSATADYTDWATYHALIVKSNTITALTTYLNSVTPGGYPISNTVNEQKDWSSVWALRAGTEYNYSEAWKLRAGAFYDFNPVSEKHFDTLIPDSDRVAVSIGAGYTKNSITVDVSYAYLMFVDRTISNNLNSTTVNGKYKASAQLPSIGVSYKF